MIYLTQLIYLRPGGEVLFDQFESMVLPLLADHHGQLLLRIRPEAGSFVESNFDQPYEIHLVAFESRQDFEQYAQNPLRQQYLHWKEQSVEKIVLIEGKMV